jgi:hypothetical protein
VYTYAAFYSVHARGIVCHAAEGVLASDYSSFLNEQGGGRVFSAETQSPEEI